jgi:formylmethanofuran dehydrogenase subunit C
VTAYRLQWKTQPLGPIDGSALRPDVLCAKSPDQVAGQVIRCGRANFRLDEVFEITQCSENVERLSVMGHPHFIGLGAGLSSGELIVDGPAGHLLGQGMTGGQILVRGDAGERAGAAMRGGRIVLHGSAGSLAGGPAPGGEFGMTGGSLVIHGNAGAYLALRQRRGLVAVTGEIGAQPALRMAGGTLYAPLADNHDLGLGMSRGTIISFATGAPPLTFADNGLTLPVFLRLLWRRLQELGLVLPKIEELGQFRRFSGDRRYGSHGELFCAAIMH